MKKVISLLLAVCLVFGLTGCGSKDEATSDLIVYVESADQSTEQKDTYKPDVDELEANLPGSKYELYYGTSGSAAQCTISFFDDISRSGDVLEGHCQRTWYDGSKGDKVSYRYSGGKLYINQLSDEKIAMGYTDNKYDYIVYKNYLIEDKEIKNAKITTDGNFDALIGGYQKYNSDGTVTVKEYKIDDTVVFEEGHYSGTYTRDGNIVKCDTYCKKNNRNNTWYMYIDDYGYVYSEVFVCKSFISSKNTASTPQTTTNNESYNDFGVNNSNNLPTKNNSSQSNAIDNTTTENINHLCSCSAATCTKPKTCLICNATYGEPLEHQWLEATCTKPKQCKMCDKVSGEPIEHSWSEATCTEPKRCTVCKTTTGAALGHSAETSTSLICNRCYDAFSPDAENIIKNIPIEILGFYADSITAASISECSYSGGTKYSVVISIEYQMGNFNSNFGIYAYDDFDNVICRVSQISGWYTNGSGVETMYIPINSKVKKIVIK